MKFSKFNSNISWQSSVETWKTLINDSRNNADLALIEQRGTAGESREMFNLLAFKAMAINKNKDFGAWQPFAEAVKCVPIIQTIPLSSLQVNQEVQG